MKLKIKIGDSVIVSHGIKEPDFGEFEIGGWQGRIVEIDKRTDNDNILITIEWDSLTLKQIPSDYIEQSENEGYDWQNMTLYDSDLEKTNPRDNKESVKKNQDELADKYNWVSFGAKGLRIYKVLGTINPQDEMKCLQKWVAHLDKELIFPIDAIVSESEDNWLIKTGDKVLIKSLPHIVDMYGIIASIKLNGKKYEFPLCDLEAKDRGRSNFQLIDDYRTWFVNR
jgi:hypothetical protein